MRGVKQQQWGRPFGAVAVPSPLTFAPMRQSEIADWVRRMLEKHNLSPYGLAMRAGLGKDTVNRALDPDYPHVTSTRTLSKIAETLGETAPRNATAPSAASLLPVVEMIGNAARASKVWGEAQAMPFAEALHDTLQAIADDPEALGDPRIARALARVGFRRLRD